MFYPTIVADTTIFIQVYSVPIDLMNVVREHSKVDRYHYYHYQLFYQYTLYHRIFSRIIFWKLEVLKAKSTVICPVSITYESFLHFSFRGH
jgi:hypothetical protein